MKSYGVKLKSTATIYIEVVGQDEDDAIEIAMACIDPMDVNFGEWEVIDVDVYHGEHDD